MINPDDIKAGYTLGHADAQILRDAVKELIALRKAFSEPAGYVNELYFEKDVISGRLYVELSEAMSRHEYISFVPLYRKPPTE